MSKVAAKEVSACLLNNGAPPIVVKAARCNPEDAQEKRSPSAPSCPRPSSYSLVVLAELGAGQQSLCRSHLECVSSNRRGRRSIEGEVVVAIVVTKSKLAKVIQVSENTHWADQPGQG